jgi:hypothetical protein
MSKVVLRGIAYVSFLIAFAALAVPSALGGIIFSLKIENGRFYLYGHGEFTEVEPWNMLWLAGLCGAGLLALLTGLLSLVVLIVKMRRSDEGTE